jgi:hypothetical protein
MLGVGGDGRRPIVLMYMYMCVDGNGRSGLDPPPIIMGLTRPLMMNITGGDQGLGAAAALPGLPEDGEARGPHPAVRALAVQLASVI